MNEKRSLTTGEVAKFCGVSFRTVIRWIDKGHIKAYHLPGRGDRRIEVVDFLDFLRDNDMPIPEEFATPARRALIVEDDIAVSSVFEQALNAGGFTTAVARNGIHAGSLFETFQPAIMILDLRMPELSGMEVIRFVRAHETLSDIKILVVSGADDDDLESARRGGADAVLRKPVKPSVLLEAIDELLPVSVDEKRSAD